MDGFNVNFYFTRKDSVNYHVPFHTHQCYEFIYYFSGQGHCTIDQTDFRYEKGYYVIVPPMAQHNDVHDADCQLLCLGITLPPDAAQVPKGVYRDSEHAVLYNLRIIEREFKKRQLDYIGVINNCIYNILTEAKRVIALRPCESLSRSETLAMAISYLNEYFLSEITAEQLTNITNYSYHRFRHIFKTAVGISPKQYVLYKRIEYAKNLLTTTDKTVTEIGSLSAFSTTSLFIKFFREHTGTTPMQYRKQLRSDSVFSLNQTTYLKQDKNSPL